MCACVRCVRITISLYNNYFWGFYLYIFVDLILKSMVCSPLSVRYGSIKITAIIMIKNGPGHSEQCQKLNLRLFTIQCVSFLLSFFQLQWLCCWFESSIHFSMPWYRKAWGVNILKQKETKTDYVSLIIEAFAKYAAAPWSSYKAWLFSDSLFSPYTTDLFIVLLIIIIIIKSSEQAYGLAIRSILFWPICSQSTVLILHQ